MCSFIKAGLLPKSERFVIHKITELHYKYWPNDQRDWRCSGETSYGRKCLSKSGSCHHKNELFYSYEHTAEKRFCIDCVILGGTLK